MFRYLLQALGLLPKPQYTLDVFNRDNFLYREGDHKLVIYGQMLTGPFVDFVIYTSEITNWEAPHNDEPISAEQKQIIVERLDQYLKRRGVRYTLN
jgi:hypothetical protein